MSRLASRLVLAAFAIALLTAPSSPALAQGGPPIDALHVADESDLPPDPRSPEDRIRTRGTPLSATGWKDQALACRDRHDYAAASHAYFEAARRYQDLGEAQMAKIMTTFGQRYETRVGLFYDRPADRQALRRHYLGRRLEPLYGAYLGAFIDREDGIDQTFSGSNGQTHRDAGAFNRAIGKPHATFFMYNQYGRPFPEAWFANLKANHAGAQWVIQPRNLEEVQENAYLIGLAKSTARTGVPTFVRFAGEMNGSWVPYHGDPEAYRQKFRLVARIFHQYAPNAAMVWCPNEIPEAQISAYYPGPDAVDWVGVNFYSVLYNDNDPRRPVSWRNPADALDFIYRHYSDRHPILIGEYGATHQCSADGVAQPDFAATKLAQLYAALPRRYPRVKAVHYFSMNALKYAEEGRRLNNYALLDSSAPEVSATYRQMIRSPYFLEKVESGVTAPIETAALTTETVLKGQVTLSAYAKTYELRPRVTIAVNGRTLRSSAEPGSYTTVFDTKTVPDGPATLTVSVTDSDGHIAGQDTITVRIANGSPAPPKAIPVATKPPAKTTPPVTVAPVPLRHLLETSAADTQSLALTMIPEASRLTLGQRLRLSLQIGKAGFLVVLLTDEKGETTPLYPRKPEDFTREVAVKPGELIEIPSDPKRALRPDTPGDFTVTAYLFPMSGPAGSLYRSFASGSLTREAANRLWQQTFPAQKVIQAVHRVTIVPPAPEQ